MRHAENTFFFFETNTGNISVWLESGESFNYEDLLMDQKEIKQDQTLSKWNPETIFLVFPL